MLLPRPLRAQEKDIRRVPAHFWTAATSARRLPATPGVAAGGAIPNLAAGRAPLPPLSGGKRKGRAARPQSRASAASPAGDRSGGEGSANGGDAEGPRAARRRGGAARGSRRRSSSEEGGAASPAPGARHRRRAAARGEGIEVIELGSGSGDEGGGGGAVGGLGVGAWGGVGERGAARRARERLACMSGGGARGEGDGDDEQRAEEEEEEEGGEEESLAPDDSG